MTIEEAIKVLRTESVEIGGSATSVCRFWEALDMAVKALKDVPDKDVCNMTNADRIRVMSEEELAKFLAVTAGDKIGGMAKFWLEWLQMPAEEDDHA